jgi:hypothetical protein
LSISPIPISVPTWKNKPGSLTGYKFLFTWVGTSVFALGRL